MAEALIVCENVQHIYRTAAGLDVPALRGIDLAVPAGEYLAIVGPNGSGKSTLARHLNALLLPTEGRVRVVGLDTREPAHTIAIRRQMGMVFQQPDSQIVGTIVEEDVAFGPENLGVPQAELAQRVRQALELVGLWEMRKRAPHTLSGGQKQRVAMAGVLAMQPACLVLDEATAMLDPRGRGEVLETVRRLNRQGVTVVAITHFMEEAALADRVIVLFEGRVALQGAPRELFSRPERLREYHLALPAPARLAEALRAERPALPMGLLGVAELVRAVDALAQEAGR